MDGIRQKSDHIAMKRHALSGLPPVSVPQGYTLRIFRPGDEAAWADLMAAAFPEMPDARGIPEREFLRHAVWRPARLLVACKDDKLVACAAAWEQPTIWGPRSGLVHWVATHPDHQRRGLARATVTAALHWMSRRYDNAVLVTQVDRLPAVRLYLDLGFVPHLMAFPEMAARWATVKAELRGLT